MNQEILDFLKTERIGVIAVRMPDGTPHAATVGFAYAEEPIEFVIQTDPSYRKYEPLRQGVAVPASFVVGTNEANMKTLQLDGVVVQIDSGEREEMYYARFTEKRGKFSKSILLSFKPVWWRYTDWTKPGGKVVLTSDDAKKNT